MASIDINVRAVVHQFANAVRFVESEIRTVGCGLAIGLTIQISVGYGKVKLIAVQTFALDVADVWRCYWKNENYHLNAMGLYDSKS